MAKIHVLRGNGPNVYAVAIHVNTPAGNNLAGVPWSTAIVNSGRNHTEMTIGTGSGQISQAEVDQITAGTLIEAVLMWGDDPAWTNPQRLADLDLRATQLAAETVARIQQELKYFGFTRN